MAVRAPVQEVRRSLLGWTPDRIDPHAAFRCALGIAIPLLGGMLLGHPALGGAAAIGAWSAGLTTFHRDARPRPMLAVLAGTVMGLGVLIGGHTAGFPVLSIAVTMVWCLGFGLIGTLSDIAGSVAVTCGTAIFLAHGLTVDNSPETAALAALAGGVTQAVIVVLLPRHRHRSERMALAGVYHWLAAEARATADETHGPPSTAPLELAEQVLETHRETPEVFLTALTHARRLRAVIAAVGSARSRLADADPTAARHLAAVLREAADALDIIADALAEREVPKPAWHKRLSAAVEQVREDNKSTYLPVPEYESTRLLSLVRAAATTAATPTVDEGDGDRMDASRWRLVPDIPPVREMFKGALVTLRANLSWRSTALRQALRTSMAVGIAMVGALWWQGDHGYWLPLTAWLVLKADFAGTIGKGVGRTIGTTAGALVAGLLSSLLPVDPIYIAPVVIVFAFVSYLLFQASYVLYSASVAAFVVFNMELGGDSPLYAATQRVAATIVGGVFALLFFLAWPKWETPLLGERLADLTERYAAYADLVLSRHAKPSRRKEGKLRKTLDDLRLARAEMDAAIVKAAAEPVTAPGPMSADARRISYDLGWAARPMMVLEAHLPDVDSPELPPVDEFRGAVAAVYAEIASRLRGSEPDPEPVAALRAAYEHLVADTAEGVTPVTITQPTARRRALYKWEGDVLVGALESACEHVEKSTD
ncbi:FUSC family protein [Phytomonospora endophytica]|uniref:Putative membrane protein YccC n=1 Tax=Phytomonospora endophytica TaxID=714109 RepID=A0A841FL76_9ACTN|nr:FUSC family protein [Phytomonospora endophytica]MBB6036614.1 putative membrane protein YccC [Phytomonospora endophytica]